MNRKIRADSVLGTLPEDRQGQIAEYGERHSLDDTVEWLRADGLKVSRSSLADWLSSYRTRALFRLAESDAMNFVELLHQKRPELSESELQGWANEFFQVQAVKSGDAKMYLQFATARHKADMDRLNFEQRERSLRTREETLSLEREKFQFDAAEACLKFLPQLRQIAAAPKLNQAEKITAIRQKLFGTLPQEEGK